MYDPKIEEIAHVCHEMNRRWCQLNQDYSQPPWESAPEWQRESAINGVLFHLNNPDAGPEASHNSWLEEKKKDGWKWGSVKDPEKKEHPCFLPYEQLPPIQKAKDSIFIAVVRGYPRRV